MGLCAGMSNGSGSHSGLQSGDSIVTSCSATVGGPSMVMSIPTNESRYEDDLLDDHVHSSDDYEDHFEGLEVGNDHVPLGDILEKLEACSDAKSGLIRLHASAENGSPTISATVNVATLDLSDPESIHQHLSQLNDTVLKVSTTCLNLNSVALPLDGYNDNNDNNINNNNPTTNNNNNDNNTDNNNRSVNDNHRNSTSNHTNGNNNNKNSNGNKNENNNDQINQNNNKANSDLKNQNFDTCAKEEADDSSSFENSQYPTSTNSRLDSCVDNCPTTTTINNDKNNVTTLLSSLIVSSSPTTIPPTPTTSLLPTSPCPTVTLSSLNPLPPQNQAPQSQTSVDTQSIKSPTVARRTASNGKPITQICSICSKAFSNASALAKHRLTHSEERRYQCNICSKAFKRQDHLNGHLLTHRSTKPFACMAEGCGKSYCDARSLRRHKENHHSNLKEVSNGPNTLNNQENKTSVSTLKQSEYVGSGSTEENSVEHVSPGPVVKTKGLSPKQFQLIEQLIRDSKASSTKAAATLKPSISASSDTPSSAKHEASITASTIAAKALAAVQSKAFQLTAMGAVASATPIGEHAQTNPPPVPLPDKPVECAICQRKFKNIPALNGHMRLHGGYYKKDADGRRIIPQQPIVSQSHSTTNNTATSTDTSNTALTSHLRPLLEEGMKKRKHEDSEKGVITACMGNDRLPPEAVKMLHQHNNSNQPPLKMPHLSTSSSTSTSQLTITPATPSTPLPNLSFRSLPPPNTSQLLANLEIKAKERESFTNPVTSGYGDMANEVISMVTSALNITSSVQSLATPVSNGPLIFPNRPVPMSSVSNTTASQLLNLSSNMATTVVNALSSVKTLNSYGPSLISSPLVQRPPTPPMLRCPTQMLRVDNSLDKTPKVGPEHQAVIPDLLQIEPEDLECEIMWDPAMGDKVDSHAMQSLLQLASSSLMPGASKNEETALKILQNNGGDVEASLQQLLSFDVLESEPAWSENEVNTFYESLVHHHKNFSKISREIGSKSVKDVVEFYYLWKNICRDESQSFKTIFSSTLNVSAQVNGKTGIQDGEATHNNNNNSSYKIPDNPGVCVS